MITKTFEISWDENESNNMTVKTLEMLLGYPMISKYYVRELYTSPNNICIGHLNLVSESDENGYCTICGRRRFNEIRSEKDL